MTTIGALIKRHPVLAYALVFGISWGGILIVGPCIFGLFVAGSSRSTLGRCQPTGC